MIIKFTTKKGYTDTETVDGLQQSNHRVEEWFYTETKNYFNEHYNDVFFDKDRKQEIFQSAFVKLWTEIANKKIRLVDGVMCRQQPNGQYKPMTCTLTTFLMAFAKTENREIVRHTKDVYVEEVTVSGDGPVDIDYADEEDMRDQKIRIVDDCIQKLSPHCIEIVTLFFHQKKSLDEILLLRKDSNTTKTGLKSAKAKCMATLKARAREEMNRMRIVDI